MYCKYCGKQIEDNSRFCSSCGRNLETVTIPTNNMPIQIDWVLIFVAAGLLLLSLVLALNFGDASSDVEDGVMPIVLSLGAAGISGYVYISTQRRPDEKKKNFISLLVMASAAGLAVLVIFAMLVVTINGG